MSQTAKRLSELGIVLPKPAAPVANYVPWRQDRRHGAGRFAPFVCLRPTPVRPGRDARNTHKGKLGPDSPVEAAREAAERCAINILAQAQAALGDLDKVLRVVRLGGFFNVASSFDALPQAMNGASDLMAEVFGERGRHARTTVGVAHLPMNALAEVEALFEIST